MSTAPRPQGIPLRPDPSAIRRAGLTALMRTAAAHLIATVEGGSPDEIVARMWPNDRDAGMLVRGAVSPASTSNTPALVQTLVSDFIATLTPLSAGAALLERCLRLTFDGAGAISVPAFVADANNAGFVAQGAPIPVRQLTVKPTTLEPYKLASISPFTGDMASGSNVQAMVADVMPRDMALALDKTLFDANPAIPETRPAGLRNGIAALPATAATDPVAAMMSDVAAVLGAVSAVAGNSLPVLIAAPARATIMRLHGPAGLQSTTILASSAIAPGDLIAVAPNAVVSAFDSVPDISVSRETVLHMADDPTNIGTAGTPATVAAPAQSLWQSDVIALKVRMEATWARRDDRAVAWLTATAW